MAEPQYYTERDTKEYCPCGCCDSEDDKGGGA